MFPKGTVVHHRGSGRSGRVLECDGDTVYIVQDNGAELDLPGADLTTRRPDAMAPVTAAAYAPPAHPRRYHAGARAGARQHSPDDAAGRGGIA